MSNNIFQIAEKSIAFDINVVDRLNKKTAKIDPRLYLFAYYQPKPMPQEVNAYICFCTAVLNMYGLLWDCGKMVQHQFLGLTNKNQMPSAFRMLVDTDLIDCEEFFSIIFNVRTCICHNNSDNFFYNRDKSSGCQRYLEKAAGDSIPIHTYTDLQWTKVCQDFIDRCEWFVSILECFLDQILIESDLQKTNDIIQYWIDSICRWYQTDIELIAHVLADRYKLKISISSQQQSVVTKYTVTKWIGLAWRKRNPPLILAKLKDYYWNYITICQYKVSNILDDQGCPKPALPLDVLSKATTDARSF